MAASESKNIKSPVKKKAAKKKSAKKKAVNKKQGLSRELKLDSVLVINDAVKLQDTLNEYVKTKTPVTLIGSDIEMIDTAIIQLIYAFIKKMYENKTGVVWRDPSPELISRVGYLGLTSQLLLDDLVCQ